MLDSWPRLLGAVGWFVVEVSPRPSQGLRLGEVTKRLTVVAFLS